ncbi:MAG: BrnT family toxin [Cyanobacteria bacterium P01_G01_bin.39]
MFEWDDVKAASNETKHSVSFPFAVRAFEDENRLTVMDNRSDYGEIRYVTLARIEKRVYVLVYTLRNSVIRLISARKANTKEVKRYDNR